jgi:hypothetical protein
MKYVLILFLIFSASVFAQTQRAGITYGASTRGEFVKINFAGPIVAGTYLHFIRGFGDVTGTVEYTRLRGTGIMPVTAGVRYYLSNRASSFYFPAGAGVSWYRFPDGTNAIYPTAQLGAGWIGSRTSKLTIDINFKYNFIFEDSYDAFDVMGLSVGVVFRI